MFVHVVRVISARFAAPGRLGRTAVFTDATASSRPDGSERLSAAATAVVTVIIAATATTTVHSNSSRLFDSEQTTYAARPNACKDEYRGKKNDHRRKSTQCSCMCIYGANMKRGTGNRGRVNK